MPEYKSLTDAEVREIAIAYYEERRPLASSREQPVVVLVGGQPGAGKSAVAHMVRAELVMQGGYIHIDADRMREYILLGNSKPASEQTQADAGRLVRTLRDLTIQARHNIVEEGTFRSPDSAGKFVQGLLERGYRAELFAVATPREESLVGIYQRHEVQHAVDAPNPRFVSEKYHDEALQGFEDTLARTAAQFNRVRVGDRAGAVLYDSAIQARNQSNPLEALAAGRKLSDSKLAEVIKAWSDVAAIAIERKAPADYFKTIGGQIQRLEDMKKERIHGHAMNQLDTNAAILVRDARYAQHTGDELAKAAYFRGFHQKSSEFQGTVPDFAKYDATAADRQTLRQLPDVTDLAGRAVQRAQRSGEGNSL